MNVQGIVVLGQLAITANYGSLPGMDSERVVLKPCASSTRFSHYLQQWKPLEVHSGDPSGAVRFFNRRVGRLAVSPLEYHVGTRLLPRWYICPVRVMRGLSDTSVRRAQRPLRPLLGKPFQRVDSR